MWVELLDCDVNNVCFPEFQKLWRSVPVDSIDEEKIEEYLNRQGISSMQETGPKKMVRISQTPTIEDFHALQIVRAYLCVGDRGLPWDWCDMWLVVTDAHSEEEETGNTEKETVQDTQRPS